MPLSSLGCSCGSLVLTAALTLLLLPANYLVPQLFLQLETGSPHAAHVSAPLSAAPLLFSLDRFLALCPPVDLFLTVIIIATGLFVYLCEWIQRKLMERRILKVKKHLSASVERLRAWEAKQEQVERTLRLVQGAAGEYSLLLFLLLRRRRAAPACHFDKDLDAELG